MAMIPSLPTDNLYKFVALSGIALMITSLLLSRQLKEDAKATWIEAVNLNIQELDNGRLFPSDSLRRNTLREKADDLYSTGYIEIWMVISTMMFGLVCAIWGFRKWYVKVQKYQDAILEGKAAEAALKRQTP